ncbi:MAG: high-potential iron-sulfur protein [Bacteroidetes bacterium]|nr:high-potential iron-sulfur protein [Bacteroidota bacterium]
MGSSRRIDAKWLFGLICLSAVIVAAVLYSASKLTERDAATGLFSGVMTSLAMEDNGAEGFEELQALAAANPDEEFTIEGATLPVKGSEIAGLSYDEAVDLVVGRIAQTLYTDGPDAVEQFFADTPAADTLAEESVAEGFTCTDTEGLTEAELTMRNETFKYVDTSTEEGKTCDNCALYVAAAEGQQCGTCTIIKGPIHPNGYCISWAPKPA